MKRALFTSAFGGALTLGVVAACNDVASPGTGPVTLTFAVQRFAASSAIGVATETGIPGQAAADLTANDGVRCVTLSAVDLRFSRIDFERADAFDDADTDDD